MLSKCVVDGISDMMKSNFNFQYLLDPRKVIMCCTIFLVVHSVDPNDAPEQKCTGCPNCEPSAPEEVGHDNSCFGIKENLTEELYLPWLINQEPEQPKTKVGWWGHVFTPNPTPNTECEQQVRRYLMDLTNFQLWAMQMWDATAKPSSGLLSGNTNQLGDYDSCLGVQFASLGALQGKYCLADIDLEASATARYSVRAAVTRLQAGAFVRSKHSDPGHFAPRWSTLHWGLCVPVACSHQEVERGLGLYLEAYRLPGVTVDIAVKPGMCYTTLRDTSLPIYTLVTIGFFGGIMMLAAVATVMDNCSNFTCKNKLKARDRALIAFSVRRNWQLLLSRQTDELPVIHGIRSVFTVMLFAGHKLMPLSLTPYANRGLLTQCSHSVFSSILRASSVFTDSFLQLSAVLAAYNFGKELHRCGRLSWKHRLLARYIRLTPSLFAVVVFYAYVMEHLGSGPQWSSSITANADLCKSNFWRNIIYIQNFFQFEDMCAPHTHQLALDIQLFLTAPVIIYCLHYWPRRSAAGLIVLQLAVAALRYFTYLHNHLSLFIYHNISLTTLYRTANMSYIQAIQRSIPYMVGLITGFFLQRREKFCLSYVQASLGWVACVTLAAVSVFYPSHLAKPNAVFDVADSALYSAFFPITWSLALAWLIIACSCGYGGSLHIWLCHYWLLILSRLSYSIYLIQFIIFFYYVGSIRSSQEFNLIYAVGVYEVGAILLASVCLTLLFDLPMQEIKSILISTRMPDKGS